jgi:hypothetical protein
MEFVEEQMIEKENSSQIEKRLRLLIFLLISLLLEDNDFNGFR